jgi:selenocysteine-specific elongation factor
MESIGLTDLVDTLKAYTYRPKRNPEGPFVFSVDHCFSIRGQGTVMTGTVLSGKAVVNDVRLTYSQTFLCSHLY